MILGLAEPKEGFVIPQPFAALSSKVLQILSLTALSSIAAKHAQVFLVPTKLKTSKSAKFKPHSTKHKTSMQGIQYFCTVIAVSL